MMRAMDLLLTRTRLVAALLQVREEVDAGAITMAEFLDKSIAILGRAKEMAAEERRRTESETRPSDLTEFNLITGSDRPLEDQIDEIVREYAALREQARDE
jgi:hypothetical protein